MTQTSARHRPISARLRSAFFATAVLVALPHSAALAQCNITPGPTNNCGYGDAVDTFTLNGISATNFGCSGGMTGYTFFNTPVWNLSIGQTYNWSADTGGGQYNQGLSIWIDLNDDDQFEASERLASSPAALTHSGMLTIPGTTAAANNVRMRVMATYNTVASPAQACTGNIGNYGETEDYEVNLLPSEAPLLGAAKQMSVAGTGPYTVTIDYGFENFGDVALSNLSAADDLTAVFGATPADWTFTSITKLTGPASFDVNAGFDGSVGAAELINTGSSLDVGETGSLRVVLSVTTPGSYTNQVTVMGESPLSTVVSDLSTNGTDPDPDGDDNPAEAIPSTVSFETPSVGASKQMSATGNGPFTVTIDYGFENFGDVTLSNLTAPDDLTAVFGGTPANWTFTSITKLSGPASFDINGAYNGSPGNAELLTAGASLNPGEAGSVRVVISVTPTGSYTNQVTVMGESPLAMVVSDLSTDGADPDPSGDGNPAESTPSPLTLGTGVIGAAKQMTATGTGPYSVTIDHTFENLGNVVISSLSAPDDLTAVFGPTPGNWTLTSIVTLSGPAGFGHNAGYTGQGPTTELINPGSSLAPGEIGQVRVVVSVGPAGTYTNQVTVTGLTPSAATISDISTEGTDPDPDSNGDPSENTVSSVGFENLVVGVAKDMVATGQGPWAVTISYSFENLGDVTASNLSASDDLVAVFGVAGTDWQFVSIAQTGGPATFDANAAFDGEATTELIAAASSLAPLEAGQIEVVINVLTPGNFLNQVTLTGESPTGAVATDDSDAGQDPDPNGDGNPNEGEPTSLVLLASALVIPALDGIGLGVLSLLLTALGIFALARRRA